MVRVAVHAGQKVQDLLSYAVQINEDLIAYGKVDTFRFGRICRGEETIISSRERRFSLTLLQDPVRFGHADVSKMPTYRTKLLVNLSAKINLVDPRTKT
jgi:hypothetical protein